MTRARRILVGDPSPLFRRGIRLALAGLGQPLNIEEADRLEAGQARLGSAAVPATLLSSSDLLILSGNLPGLKRWQQLQHLQRPVLLVTEGVDHEMQRKARRHRVAGVIQRGASPESLSRAVDALLQGERSYPWPRSAPVIDPPAALNALTPQQARVLGLVREGLGNKQIAARLHLSESTVKHHITRLYRLLDFDSPNRTLLALNALPARDLCSPRGRAG